MRHMTFKRDSCEVEVNPFDHLINDAWAHFTETGIRYDLIKNQKFGFSATHSLLCTKVRNIFCYLTQHKSKTVELKCRKANKTDSVIYGQL